MTTFSHEQALVRGWLRSKVTLGNTHSLSNSSAAGFAAGNTPEEPMRSFADLRSRRRDHVEGARFLLFPARSRRPFSSFGFRQFGDFRRCGPSGNW